MFLVGGTKIERDKMGSKEFILRGIWFLPDELKIVRRVYLASTEKSFLRFCGRIVYEFCKDKDVIDEKNN